MGTLSTASPSGRPDAELACAARRGEREAFVEIVARHQALVCGVAYGILNDLAASEDAAQEAFVTAWRKMAELRAPHRLRPWLATVAKNTALGKLRARRDTVSLGAVADARDPSPLPDEAAASEEEAALVRAQLARLPENFRLPLVLFYRDGQSVRAVAEALELSEGAVKLRLARGRALLRERMAGLIESTLTRTRPTALFTMAVATAIGALKAPSAVAASAFAATSATAGSSASAGAAASSSATATSNTIPALTAMVTSHTSIIVPAALVAVLCLPLGYSARMGLEPEPPAADQPSSPPPSAQLEPRDPLELWPDSSLLAEWKRLHETYGTDAQSMPALHDAIEEIEDTFQRDAFRAALAAEWAALDPAGGFAFFRSDSDRRNQLGQIFDEWLALDPAAAVEALLAAPEGLEGFMRGRLSEVARAAPDRLAETVRRLPEPDGYWRREVAQAFAIAGEINLASARAAAESLSGKNGDQALAGVALAWGKRDGDAAIAWARELPESVDRDEVIRSALIGLAESEPARALAMAGIVPPGGSTRHFASTTGARVLKAAAEADFESTIDWLTAHPERFGREDLLGIAHPVTRRLNEDPIGFLNERLGDGSLERIVPAISSAVLNDAGGQREMMWDWIRQHGEEPGMAELREAVLQAALWQDRTSALRMVSGLAADSPANVKLRERFARELFSSEDALLRFDSVMADVPASLRESALRHAFGVLSADTLGNPQAWIARRSELSPAERLRAAQSIARAWVGRDPGSAIAWAASLPPDDGRREALQAAASGWSSNDPLAASEWLAGLPAGADRDLAAGALAHSIAGEMPYEAWRWAASVEAPEQRAWAIDGMVEGALREKSATLEDVEHWIAESSLPPAERASLLGRIEQAKVQRQLDGGQP